MQSVLRLTAEKNLFGFEESFEFGSLDSATCPMLSGCSLFRSN